jgi:hypothetical protein
MRSSLDTFGLAARVDDASSKDSGLHQGDESA